MAALKYFESTVRSKALLKQVIAFIGTHHLSANPINYTVCYEYLLGNLAPLKQAIDKTLQDSKPLTNLMMEEWFGVFLAGYDQDVLKQAQADLMAVIAKLHDSTEQAEQDVSQFDQSLQNSEKELVAANQSLESIVAQLLENTRMMQTSMDLMKQQVLESKQEISSLQERLEKTTEEALSDPLTGLTNRKGLSQAFEKALLTLEGEVSYPSLMMLDIDHFKKINDSFGHLIGDRVIKVVGEALKSQIKGKDTAARYGGEEFCILLPETKLLDAVKLAETIRLSVEKTRIKRSSDNHEICRVTISIGVARYKLDEPLVAFFERADSALYRAKNEGRNRVVFTDD